MHCKKYYYDTMLTIALVLSVLRIDWQDYLQGQLFVSQTGLQDIILGPSVGLTETQFHNLFNTAGQVYPKNIVGLERDFYYNQSIFRELDSLYHGLPLISDRTPVTTFLLERHETNNARTSGPVMVAQPPPVLPLHEQNNNANSNADNHAVHESDSDEGFSEMEMDMEIEEGAVGQSLPSPTLSDELSVEDMDLIESLWRQDIDMGVCPDTYPYKADINKPGFTDELNKQAIDLWDYSIDGETGEYMPGPHPADNVQPSLEQPVPHQMQQPQPDTQESSLSLEDCLQLLEDEYSSDGSASELSPSLSPQEVEQRWQDLATIPELQGSIPDYLSNTTVDPTQESYVTPPQLYLQGMTNGTGALTSEVNEMQAPQMLSDVFAVNASTNGMVSLQNATHSHQQPLLMPPPNNETFNNFANLNLDSPPHSGNNTTTPSNDNITEYLMQTLQQQMSSVNASAPYTSGVTDNSSSLLMELLNSPGAAQPINPMDFDFDEQMQDVLAALGSEAGDDALSDDEDSDGSTFEESEGATGYSSGSDQGAFKGATGGFGGYPRGHERQYGSDSSSNSYSSQPPKMENIKHNHSYAASSQSQMQNGNGAHNSSINGTTADQLRYSRDEKRAKALKLPISVDKIINLPVDAFNDLMKKYELNDPQMQLVRDIRRRGKNKVAAQNCRKRKIDAIMMVESTVSELRMERDKLVKERDNIDKEVSEMQQRYAELCEEVFSTIQDEHGGPVDPNDYTLQQLPDGTFYLIPRNSNASTSRDSDEQSM